MQKSTGPLQAFRAATTRTGSPDPAPANPTTRSAAVYVLAAYAASRILVLVGLLISHLANPGLTSRTLFAPWDGTYYLAIADHGYDQAGPNAIAFFPGYPLLLRAISSPGGNLLAWAIGVNLLLGAGAALAVLALARRVLPAAAARRTAVLFCVFPGSVVFSFAYAEALLIVLAALTLLALHTGHHILGGLAAAAATATRPIAAALIAATAYAAWRATLGAPPHTRRWTALAAPPIAASGILTYFAWLWHHTGDPLAWFTAQRDGWGQHLDFGRTFATPLLHPTDAFTATWLAYGTGFAILTLYAINLHRGARLPATHTIYSLAVLTQCLLYSGVGPRVRFLLTAFPLLMLPTQHWRTRTYTTATAISALLLIGAAILHTAPTVQAP